MAIAAFTPRTTPPSRMLQVMVHRADGRYKANFTKGGLMVPESRLVADLLLQGVDAAGWRQAIEGG